MQTSSEPNLGTAKHPQWYEKEPLRLTEERQLVESHYPHFIFRFDNDANAVWEGTITLDSGFGRCSFSEVPVRIVCPANYPRAVPAVYDRYRKIKSPHVETDSRICLENGCVRLENLYTGRKRIKDTIDSAYEFLKQHWYWRQESKDIAGQAHGQIAFIEFELSVGCQPLERECLCARHGKAYGDCCYPKVQQIIEVWDKKLHKQKGAERCRCGSGRTYRKCGMRRKCSRMRYCDKRNPLREYYWEQLYLTREKQLADDRRNNA